jgi:hypothetical protein
MLPSYKNVVNEYVEDYVHVESGYAAENGYPLFFILEKKLLLSLTLFFGFFARETNQSLMLSGVRGICFGFAVLKIIGLDFTFVVDTMTFYFKFFINL